jgi:hypothetical protein
VKVARVLLGKPVRSWMSELSSLQRSEEQVCNLALAVGSSVTRRVSLSRIKIVCFKRLFTRLRKDFKAFHHLLLLKMFEFNTKRRLPG